MASGGGFPLYPEILQYYTMILQRHRIIVGDAGFEPGTSGALPNEPLLYISNIPTAILFIQQACLLNSMTEDCKKRVKHFPKNMFSGRRMLRLRLVGLPLAASARPSVLLGTGFLRALFRRTGLVAGSVPTSRTELDLHSSAQVTRHQVKRDVKLDQCHYTKTDSILPEVGCSNTSNCKI